MASPVHPQLQTTLDIAYGLSLAARELLLATAQQLPAPKRRRRGATVRPGPSTPMWNSLIEAVRQELKRRGEKSKLARILGVPPQRVYDYLQVRSAMPDAERTLLLLLWLSQRRTGGDPG
ncbi:MAG TPA: hypothetical protein VHE13_15500 [Opitutus sp.]|nr:hypothetical protein [Opitutus sp.]